MADVFSKKQRSEIMSRVGTKDTAPELKVRELLHSMGFRFRLHRADLPGKPDIVLPRYETVIFVHGCFWHGHTCPRGKRPSTREEFWNEKIEGNMRRDRRAQRRLRTEGWHVLIIWQCQTRIEDGLRKRLERIRKYGDEWKAT